MSQSQNNSALENLNDNCKYFTALSIYSEYETSLKKLETTLRISSGESK